MRFGMECGVCLAVAFLIGLAAAATTTDTEGLDCEYRICAVKERCRADCGAGYCCVGDHPDCTDPEFSIFKQHYCTPVDSACWAGMCAWWSGCTFECNPS